MERLTRVIKGYGKDVVVYTKGKYEDTTAAEMEVEDVRKARDVREIKDVGEGRERETVGSAEP